MADFQSPKSKPKQTQSKPNQSQFPKNPKINATSVLANGYGNETTFSLRQAKAKQTQSNPT